MLFDDKEQDCKFIIRILRMMQRGVCNLGETELRNYTRNTRPFQV